MPDESSVKRTVAEWQPALPQNEHVYVRGIYATFAQLVCNIRFAFAFELLVRSEMYSRRVPFDILSHRCNSIAIAGERLTGSLSGRRDQRGSDLVRGV